MRRLRVRYQDSAAADIEELYLFLLSRGVSTATARNYIRRVRASCRAVGDVPEGGRARDDLAPGLRTWSFERRILIAYRIERDCVVIEHVLYAGRNLEGQRAPRKLRTE